MNNVLFHLLLAITVILLSTLAAPTRASSAAPLTVTDG